MKTIYLVLIVGLFVSPMQAQSAAAKDDVDHLALATLLLRDGHLKRASMALSQVDLKKKDVDRVQFFTVKAVVHLRQKLFDDALTAFDDALRAGAQDQRIHLSRARCAYALKRCPTVLSALESAGPLASEHSDYFMMKAQCFWDAGQHAQSLSALESGQAVFPKKQDFARLRMQRLLSLKLYQAATDVGRTLIAHEARTIDDVLFVAEALLKSEQGKLALPILETALLEHPYDNRLRIQLAHAWLKSGQPLTAARAFEKAALLDGRYAKDAAEIYRENGFLNKALKLNARIVEQEDKLRQRLAILLDLERFEAVTALEPRLSRLKILETDEEMRYAVAYAHFRMGQYTRSEGHLRQLTRPALFTRATQLRKAMAECREPDAQCD